MKLLIKNVRLESSYVHKDELIVGTNTVQKDILIEDGLIQSVEDQIEIDGIETLDAKGQLLVPSLREMHIHVDKTYFGEQWMAPTPPARGIFTRMEEESVLLPEALPHMKDKARYMVQHYIDQGHTHIRTHVNVDPHIGSKHVENVVAVMKEYEDKITYDIVAFPQHGLLRNGPEFMKTMEEALQMGVTHIGGVDPAMIDRNISGTIDAIFNLAEKYEVGIDMHLHDRDTLGAFEMHRIFDEIEKRNFKYPVTLSHAFALAGVFDDALNSLMEGLAKHNISITTTVAMGPGPITLPIDALWEAGVEVSLGHDSLVDHWSPYGTGDTIQKLNVVAERFGYSEEYTLSQLLKFATGGITPLDKDGKYAWPQVGDKANMLLVDAVSTAHMIARRCPISTVISKGNVIARHEFNLKGAYRG